MSAVVSMPARRELPGSSGSVVTLDALVIISNTAWRLAGLSTARPARAEAYADRRARRGEPLP